MKSSVQAVSPVASQSAGIFCICMKAHISRFILPSIMCHFLLAPSFAEAVSELSGPFARVCISFLDPFAG